MNPFLTSESRAFVERLNSAVGPSLTSMTVDEARTRMREMQTADVAAYAVSVKHHVVGEFSLEILRPSGASSPLPVVLFLHGGGWVIGDAKTHARIVREIVVQTQAAVVFVEYGCAPEFPFPLPLEHCYQALEWVASNGASLGLRPSRIAVVGDSAGGNLAASLALLAKERNGPKICIQALIYPVTDCDFTTESYKTFSTGLNLDRQTMEWFWDHYLKDKTARQNPLASPLYAEREALQGLPPACVITAECDVLRDEGEAYARKLAEAGVSVVAARFAGTLHGFMVTDELANDSQTIGAMQLLVAQLRHALGLEKT